MGSKKRIDCFHFPRSAEPFEFIEILFLFEILGELAAVRLPAIHIVLCFSCERSIRPYLIAITHQGPILSNPTTWSQLASTDHEGLQFLAFDIWSSPQVPLNTFSPMSICGEDSVYIYVTNSPTIAKYEPFSNEFPFETRPHLQPRPFLANNGHQPPTLIWFRSCFWGPRNQL